MSIKKKKYAPTRLWKRNPGDCLAILKPIQLFDSLVPRWINHRLSEWVGGFIIFNLMSKTRRTLKQNLKKIGQGQYRRSQVKALSRETIQNYGKYLIDYLYFPHLTLENMNRFVAQVHGGEALEEIQKQGKGGILLSPHFGHWELGGIHLALQKIPLTVVSLKTGDRSLAEYRNQVRETKGIRMVYLDPESSPLHSALELIETLRKGELLAMLGDRATGSQKITLPFFGFPYEFPTGTFILSRVSGAPIIPAFVVLEGLQYHLFLEKPFVLSRQQPRDQAIHEGAQHLVSLFEKYIRRYPSQWYNWYPNWVKE
jgi:KDO2-lipid IV(A) lauroyltransferase